ncbi:MAG: SPOR domain-containing protein [Bacteroidia bacterium]
MEHYIAELLYRHDCVIIPGFGGFVANYAPAQVHPTQHTFTPPSKSLVFNRSLKNNDGLLANYVSGQENLSYAEANLKIQEFAAGCNALLGSGKKLLLKDIGSLFPDIEKNIQFQADESINFFLGSFGFTTIQSPAIKRDGIVKRLEKMPKDRDVVPAEMKKRVSIRKIAILTLSAGMLAALVWIPLKTDLLKNFNYADLNPFSKKEAGTYSERNFATFSFSEKDLKTENIVIPDTSAYMHLSFLNKESQPLTVKLKDVAPPESTKVENATEQKVKSVTSRFSNGEKYNVIGGCFAVPENADHFVDQLKGEGYNAFILQTNRSSLRPVCYGTYASYSEALQMLAKVKASNKEAWLLVQ